MRCLRLHPTSDLAFDEFWAFFFNYVMPLASIDAGFMASNELLVVEDGNSDNRCKTEKRGQDRTKK